MNEKRAGRDRSRDRRAHEKPADEKTFNERPVNENRIEGRNAVIEAFRSGKTVDRLYMLDGSREGAMQTVRREAAKYGTPIKYVTRQRCPRPEGTRA